MKKYAVFTIDLEEFTDTGCVSECGIEGMPDLLDGFCEYISLLNRHNIKATIFAVCKAAEKMKRDVASAISGGHEIALHGLSHTAPALQTNAEFLQEIQSAKERIERLFSVKVTGYRAPFFSLDRDKLDILKSLGFTYDSSKLNFAARYNCKMDMDGFQPVCNNIYRNNGFYEFAIPYQKLPGFNLPIAGGGYVRLAQWDFVKNSLSGYLKQNNYYVFYLHPFELSVENIPYIRTLKMYDKYYLKYGFRKFGEKIEFIISMLERLGYSFVTFNALSHILSCEKAEAL